MISVCSSYCFGKNPLAFSEWISLFMHDFVITYSCHTKNIGSQSYADFPNVDTFYYAVF